MTVEIKDPMAQRIGLRVTEVRANGIVTQAVNKPEFCNLYGFAHGGFIYTMGHISAVLSAQICLGRKCIVADASCEYPASLCGTVAVAETELLRAGGSTIVYRVKIYDGSHKLCFVQMVTLRETHAEEVENPGTPRIIIPAQPGTPVDPVTGIAYPKRSTTFAGENHVYIMGRGESGMLHGLELQADVCNCYGAGHGGAVYTMCDASACGSMKILLGRNPVTVSSAIHYLAPAMNGPLIAEAKLLRAGRQLVYYDIDITDADGVLVAAAQFTLQSVDFKVNMPREYQNNAFKE